MMVFLVLGIIQLTMLHHARLMTEYAAYRAARAGIVNSGACNYMKEAAILGVLPTLGPAPGVPGRTDTLFRALLVYQSYSKLWNDQKYLLKGAPGLPVVKVEVLNPKKSELGSLFNTYGVFGGATNRVHTEEIDFDDIRDAKVIAANLLTVRVTYHYEMRIPFANKLIHSWYMGYELLKYVRGVQFEAKNVAGMNEFDALEAKGATKGGNFVKLAAMARFGNTYVVPMIATYSMRMQSNLMKKQIQGCAIN